MTAPVPSVEQRLAALEAAVASLIQEAGHIQERHTLLEERMVAGLEELKNRRPPVRRRLEELEKQMAEVIPPASEEAVTSDKSAE